MVYLCKAENMSSLYQVFLFILPPPPPPNVLSLLFLCHTQEFIRCYHVGDSQYFQCYEPFPKLGQEGHGRLVHWTENQAPKHNHVREHNFVIIDCVIFFKTFSSFFIMYCIQF